MLQIQSVFSNKETYHSLAQKYDLGFEVLELSMPMAPSVDPLAVAQWYRDSGKVTGFHGVFIDVNPASGNSTIAQCSKTQMKESCQCAKSLGSPSIVFHCSCFPFLREPYLSGWAENSAAFLDHLAEEQDLDLFIENSFDLDPIPLQALMSKSKNPRIKVCLDVGHANYSRVPVNDWFEALHEHIGYLHLSDNMGAFDDHLPIGQGTVNWALCDQWVRSIKPDLPMTLEVGGPEGIQTSLNYLKTHHLFGV